MMSVLFFSAPTRALCNLFSLIVIFTLLLSLGVAQQISNEHNDTAMKLPVLRVERQSVAGGAELITIMARVYEVNGTEAEIPMVSVLRDNMGDEDPENDRLRYVWMLTYTHPSLKQRIAAAIPFFYAKVGNKRNISGKAPPPILDLARTDRKLWNSILWMALQNLFLDSTEMAIKASANHYRRSVNDYHKVHIVRALAILSLYEADTGAQPVFTPTELRDIQARLSLTEKTLGGIVDDIYLQRVHQKTISTVSETRAQNWELLRQRAEAEGLYFEPLEQPDGSATHALIWVAHSDVVSNKNRSFNARFLNIKSPWNDNQLINWKGYKETRYFDSDNRQVSAETKGARAVQMIPLAIYGLDYPKIPALLIDFRNNLNPKKREVSRRILDDLARNVLAISKFGDVHFFLGRALLDFITDRRGIDLNQPSRLRAYSQLKLLVSLTHSLDSKLRTDISKRLEYVSINPMENDVKSEAKLANAQYQSLLKYARDPQGLPALLRDDRCEEMTTLVHGKTKRFMFRLANIMSLGLYTHREEESPELLAGLDKKRKISYHRRFLREIAKSSPNVEVVWRIEDIKRSLRFMAEHGGGADPTVAHTIAQIFTLTKDEELRRLCLSCLSHMSNDAARNELSRIYQHQNTDDNWRIQIAKALHDFYDRDTEEPSKDAVITLVAQ
jgi:hypothetical protein